MLENVQSTDALDRYANLNKYFLKAQEVNCVNVSFKNFIDYLKNDSYQDLAG